jgi:hypothetical protein
MSLDEWREAIDVLEILGISLFTFCGGASVYAYAFAGFNPW